jgi:hypothetical protein
MVNLTKLRFVAVCVSISLLCVSSADAALFERELNLPVDGISKRVTQRPEIAAGETIHLFNQSGPGCIRHWWLTYSRGRNRATDKDWAHQMRLRFFYDGASEPAIDMTLAQYFMILLEKDVFQIDSAAIKVLPKNALNSYFPIPFQELRIELENQGPRKVKVWFMADWQQYPATTALTPLRFQIVHRRESPAEPFGSIQMADLNGSGFIAGMVQAVKVLDNTDAWFHTGGDTFLLDGETAPNPLRGVGGEDVFNMSYGVWPVQNDWVGAPLIERPGKDDPLGSRYDGIMYRIFGPDPIHFSTSASLRFGTKANHIESLIYTYLDPEPAPSILAPREWKVAGPFECRTFDQFERKEWPEESPENWPDEHLADFGVYVSNLRNAPQGPTTFEVPLTIPYEHGWCDFVRTYRGRGQTNMGAQPVEASAYALGTIEVPKAGSYDLRLGFDDWIKVWIDGERVYQGRHDNGFAEAATEVELPAGEVPVLVKLANFDNMQWRLWAFALRLEPSG